VLHNVRARFPVVGNDVRLWFHQLIFMKAADAPYTPAPGEPRPLPASTQDYQWDWRRAIRRSPGSAW
jgi:hypothetical protein